MSAMARNKGEGVGEGSSGGVYQHGQFLGSFVCGSRDPAWWISGPVRGLEWVRLHAAGRFRRPDLPFFQALELS